MKKHIPNLITCMNVTSGALAIFMAMYGQLQWAALLVVLAMVFDFFDGFAARLLHVKSDMGKELDSLADVVSFGVVPAILAYFLLLESLPGQDLSHWGEWTVWQKIMLFCPVVMPAFSAYRLAKFNLDVRQATSFIGVPTPANALFWVCLALGMNWTPEVYGYLFQHPTVLGLSALILSILLITELPMFSLKLSSWSWKANQSLYCYLIALVVIAGIWGKAVLILIIPIYLLVNVIMDLKKITNSSH